jgi:hypothetical protein
MVKRTPLRDTLYVKIDGAFNCQIDYKVYVLLRERLFVILWDEIRDEIERNVRLSMVNK